MRRREFIGLAGGAAGAAMGSVAAWAQKADVRHIGCLTFDVDPEFARFKEGLAVAGWVDGRNIGIDVRDAGGDFARLDDRAAELLAAKPEIIFAPTPASAGLIHRLTRAIPIVIAFGDPVAQGMAESLSRPGGNVTGLSSFEPRIAGKWVDFLKELAPATQRIVFVYNPTGTPLAGLYQRFIEDATSRSGLGFAAAIIGGLADYESFLAQLNRDLPTSVILAPDPEFRVRRASFIALARKYRIPAMYSFPEQAQSGGLISYGPDAADQYYRAASFVDRILRGARPETTPIEFPSKFQLVINVGTATDLGLIVPQTLLVAADEVIE